APRKVASSRSSRSRRIHHTVAANATNETTHPVTMRACAISLIPSAVTNAANASRPRRHPCGRAIALEDRWRLTRNSLRIEGNESFRAGVDERERAIREGDVRVRLGRLEPRGLVATLEREPATPIALDDQAPQFCREYTTTVGALDSNSIARRHLYL